jgi:SAM-dependent methyltransferase
MLEASLQRILRELDPGDLLLDIGGWGKPLTRADWVMDLMPYETRGLYGRDGELPERFSHETWVQRDICDRTPWPFDNDQFDFVVCSHTLEDIRDPIWVCSEIVRVGKAGYIEVPSRLEEQSYGFQGPWVGWGHHRWLIDVVDDRIDFVFKHHVVHGRSSDHFPAGFQETLTPEQRVEALWWEGSFEYRERVFISAEELDPYLADYVKRNSRGGTLSRLLRRARS